MWIAFTTTIVILTSLVVIGYLIVGLSDNHEAVKRGYLSTGHENECKIANSLTDAYWAAVARGKANGQIPPDWDGPVPDELVDFFNGYPNGFDKEAHLGRIPQKW